MGTGVTHTAYRTAEGMEWPPWERNVTHVADLAEKSNDPSGDRATHVACSDGPHGYRTRRFCVFPLGEASHDAGTACVAVVVATSASVARCGYVHVTRATERSYMKRRTLKHQEK